jgi:hypothetical protein
MDDAEVFTKECPECGAAWPDMLSGHVERDVIAWWACLGCEATWIRGSLPKIDWAEYAETHR